LTPLTYSALGGYVYDIDATNFKIGCGLAVAGNNATWGWRVSPV